MIKIILGPETGTLDTVAVGCTTLVTLLIIGLAEVLVLAAAAVYVIAQLLLKYLRYLGKSNKLKQTNKLTNLSLRQMNPPVMINCYFEDYQFWLELEVKVYFLDPTDVALPFVSYHFQLSIELFHILAPSVCEINIIQMVELKKIIIIYKP